MQSSILLLFSLFYGLTIAYSCNPNDPACATCRNQTSLIDQNLFFLVCESCLPYRALNQTTNLCECTDGYYENSATTCSKCPGGCSSCDSEFHCTSCYSALNRILLEGKCVCISNYESKNGKQLCQEKPNIVVIVCSTIGGGICTMLGFVGWAFIRSRNHHTIHAQSQIQSNNEAQIENGRPSNNASNVFENVGQFPYKQNQICSICLDSSSMFMLNCQHYFHYECISQWLKSKPYCPTCSKVTKKKELKRWCISCKKVLMPIIMKISQKSKNLKTIDMITTPVQKQQCNRCEKKVQQRQRSNSHIPKINSEWSEESIKSSISR